MQMAEYNMSHKFLGEKPLLIILFRTFARRSGVAVCRDASHPFSDSIRPTTLSIHTNYEKTAIIYRMPIGITLDAGTRRSPLQSL